jgi:hypothetical protein
VFQVELEARVVHRIIGTSMGIVVLTVAMEGTVGLLFFWQTPESKPHCGYPDITSLLKMELTEAPMEGTGETGEIPSFMFPVA